MRGFSLSVVWPFIFEVGQRLMHNRHGDSARRPAALKKSGAKHGLVETKGKLRG